MFKTEHFAVNIMYINEIREICDVQVTDFMFAYGTTR